MRVRVRVTPSVDNEAPAVAQRPRPQLALHPEWRSGGAWHQDRGGTPDQEEEPNPKPKAPHNTPERHVAETVESANTELQR